MAGNGSLQIPTIVLYLLELTIRSSIEQVDPLMQNICIPRGSLQLAI